MNKMIELTDLMDGNTTPYAVVPVEDVALTIRQWYSADSWARPSELDKINDFQEALLAEDYDLARELAGELAVGFDLAG